MNSMNTETALERQLEAYRKMSGEERLAIALGLHELACNVSREGIRHQNPNASPEEVERLLKERIELGRRLDEAIKTGML